jgi:acyl CoA:acetate/3-ketoacid CoA transferase
LLTCADCSGRAAKVCIAEVEELVEPGEIKPDDVQLPGIFVDRILKGEVYSKRIFKGATEADDPEMVAFLKKFDREFPPPPALPSSLPPRSES